MFECLFLYPVLLNPYHATPPWHPAHWTGPVKFTRLRTVAKRLEPVAHHIRFPVVNNDFNWHSAAPHAGKALPFVGPGGKATVPSATKHGKVRGYTHPRRRLGQFVRATFDQLQGARLVVGYRLQAVISNRPRLPAHDIAYAESVLGLRHLPDPDEKRGLLISNHTLES